MTEAMIRKKPGMASVKDMPVLQDGPPPGGFAPVRYARRIPTKGPSAMAIFLTAFGVFSWGMYQVGKGNKIRRSLTLLFSIFFFWLNLSLGFFGFVVYMGFVSFIDLSGEELVGLVFDLFFVRVLLILLVSIRFSNMEFWKCGYFSNWVC